MNLINKIVKSTGEKVVSCFCETKSNKKESLHFCIVADDSKIGFTVKESYLSFINDDHVKNEIIQLIKQNKKFHWFSENQLLEDTEKEIEKIDDTSIKEDNSTIMSNKIEEQALANPTLVQEYAAAASDAKYFIIARQMTDGIKSLILMLVKDNLKEKNYDKRKLNQRLQIFKEDFLETNLGSIFIANVASLIIKYGAEFGQEYVEILKRPELRKFAHTLRVQAMTDGGNLIIDKLKDFIKPMFGKLSSLTGESPVRFENIKEVAGKLLTDPAAAIAKDLLADDEDSLSQSENKEAMKL